MNKSYKILKLKMKLILPILLLVSPTVNAQVNLSSTHPIELGNRFDSIQSVQNPYYSTQQQQQDPRYNPELSIFVSKSILDFAHDLSTELLKDTSVKSQIFSPTCLASSLSLLLMGSHGETFNQINRLLKFDKSSEIRSKPFKAHEELGFLLEDLKKDQIDPSRPRQQSAWRFTRRDDFSNSHSLGNTPTDHIIKISNALFVQNGYNLRYEYKSVAESVYRSEVTPLDFRGNSQASKDYINSWVREKTIGKIQSIISDDIDPATNLILASTLYFKGFWENSFISVATTDTLFYPDGKGAPGIKVKMMANGGVFPFYEDSTLGCRILGFPYKGNLTTMYIITPYDSNRNKIRHLLNVLTADKIEDMISKMAKKTAILTFPKLHISSTVHMKHLLRKMGANDIFDNRRADLSLISDGLQNHQFLPMISTFPNTQMDYYFPSNQHQVSTRPITSTRPSGTLTGISQNTPDNFNANTGPHPIQSFQMPNIMSPYDPQNSALSQAISTANYHKEHSLLGNPYQPQDQLSQNNEEPFIFTRFSDYTAADEMNLTRSRRSVKYKVESDFKQKSQPLRLKDLILRKRITKSNPNKKVIRNRRQVPQESIGLQNLDSLRAKSNLVNPGLYADDILHKIDLVINEQGTEAAAATITYLKRSGTDVTLRIDAPFILLIRHDPTRLPLFYGAVYEPTE